MKEELTARALDREADLRRDRLASTLDELSESLTPGRMLDEVLSYAKGGGGNLLMGLGKSAAANPLPTLLIGTGCALFLVGRGGIPLLRTHKEPHEPSHQTEFTRSVRTRHDGSDGILSKTAGAVSAAASTVADKVSGAVGSLASSASGLGSRITDTAKVAADTVVDTATAAGESLASAGTGAQEFAADVAGTAQGSASTAQRKARLLGHELKGKAAEAFNEYPLVVAAGGLLVGAALAAILPRTRTEDRYLGATSESVKGALADGVSQGIDRVVTGVEKVATVVSETAAQEDIVSAAKGSIDELAGKVGKTLKAGSNAINDELGTSQRPGRRAKL